MASGLKNAAKLEAPLTAFLSNGQQGATSLVSKSTFVSFYH